MGSSRQARWAVLATWLVLSWLNMAKSSELTDCYVPCFQKCDSQLPHYCPDLCLRGCLAPPDHPAHQADPEQQNQFFCQLGCFTSTCVNLSTKENPAETKVESCVNSCTHTCIPTSPGA